MFLLVALGTGVATTGISYVSARNAVLQSTQDQVMGEFLDRVREIANETPQLDVDSLGEFSSGLGGTNIALYRDRETGEIDRLSGTLDPEFVPPTLLDAVGGSDRVHFQRVDEFGDPVLYVGTTVRVGLEPTGIEVYQRFSQLGQQESLEELLSDAGAALVVSGVAALLLALLAARSVLRPVRQLSQGAKRLGDGALDTRLPVRGADEMTQLVMSFNSAAGQLEQSVDRLRREEANSRRFVADVSHELRTPLAAMTAVTETLDSEAERLGGDGALAARVLSAETHRLAALVEDLIEISRFDSGQATLVLEDVDVTSMVTGALDARGWSSLVDVYTVPAAEQPNVVVTVDPRRLDVIIANLVGNALRHGAPPVTVTVFQRAKHGMSMPWVGIAAHDSGPGVDPDVAARVFDRFYKADRARNRSHGTGLGLAIAWENARLHGGYIEVRSAAGEGTTFTLLLPPEPPRDRLDRDRHRRAARADHEHASQPR
ncbi:sensor histidine kinase, partial [Phytoactinopolyspora endophytica]|uniref:sensor histidine kinase n=1 Tax=Phytoactinopolyspora endophytica TaxID=1642495 RepID=UPI00197B6809